MTRMIGYIRVSTDEQARGGVSLDAQRDKIRAYADLVDAELVDVVEDAGLSGSDPDRPGFVEVVRRVRDGEADTLIVYAIDRLSRSTLDFLNVVSGLRDAGRGFVSVREQFDTATPHGRFTLTILAAVGELERELIRERCREASARCVRERRVFGKTPFGWKRDGKRLVENPPEMEALLEMVGLRENGVPLHVIANRLNLRRVPTKNGKTWHPSTVRSVLKTHARMCGADAA